MIAAPCQVIHVDLLQHLQGLEIAPGYRSALVIFWLRGRPLGRAQLVAGEFPLPPASVASLAAKTIAPALGVLIAPGSFAVMLPDSDNATASLKAVDVALLDRPLDSVAPVSEAAAGPPPPTSGNVCSRERTAPLAE